MQVGVVSLETPARVGMDGAMNHDDPARRHSRERSLVPTKDLVDISIVGHAETEHIRRGPESAAIRCTGSTRVVEELEGLSPSSPAASWGTRPR